MTVAAHGGDIYQNQITYDFFCKYQSAAAAGDIAETDGGSGCSQQPLSTV